ncbi:ArsR/SmtB family transcription factor [Undibacterium pigrum]|uniref:DNA-binding transcriptional ArsR family regulator n=1 Tax=Undibacterium pigrum TaxID=401470 RepID=A0A318JMP6_9BURK|nr:winged helix-turn-helix domain-containing protein [Undibacterium pigrum]PXX45241.1 DNA-binding transcriptional ArsR family regulator [Undibacterium pigrum]
MNAENSTHIEYADTQLAKLAGAIAEPARARMLCSLMDGRARTSTELAVVAEVSPSTASVHLSKLLEQHLVNVVAQGKHRYYQLASNEVAIALESLLLIAGLPKSRFVPNTPDRLRKARTCYDHMAGEVAVGVHDYLMQQAWIRPVDGEETAYELTSVGSKALEELGLDIATTRKARRRFACSCLDWSERTPHLGGALGAALLNLLINRSWLERDLDSRALALTAKGKREFQKVFAIKA